MFVVGSLDMFVGSIGEAFARHQRKVRQRGSTS